ncbi:MAG: trypsin-like serine protease [Alphaproteobacteria bacterium]|nr:trypsin-like serine protease [Alphaproteobacteria bacterium]
MGKSLIQSEGISAKRRLAGAIGIAFLLASPLVASAAGIPIDEARGGIPTLAPILELSAPGVVNIAVSGTLQVGTRNGNAQQRRVQGQGSGVIVDAVNGYVLTNNHVIENANTISVTLSDGRTLDAKLIGSDKATDIAVLKVAADHLTAVPFGEPDKLKVGDFVIAIGNPFGLGQTVTSGIISALGRVGLNIENYEDFIQTDASINPGNSGGALIDLRGRLIGINTAILGSGGNVGIGFAVPIDIAHAVMDQLVKYGDIKRGRLGVEIGDLLPDQIAKFGSTGATIKRILAGSAAEKAGLTTTDIVVGFNGAGIRSANDLRNKVALTRVGSTINLAVMRNGRTQNIDVKVTEAAVTPNL